IENRGDCIYQLTYINSPDERSAAFHLNNSQAYKIWLNDQLIAFADPDNNYLPTYQVYGGLLQKGANKLLLKSRYPMEVQVMDLAGAPFADLEYDVEVTTKTQRAQSDYKLPKPPRGNHESYLEVLKDPLKRTSDDYVCQALFYERDGLRQESFALWEELYKCHTASVLDNVVMGRAYDNNQYLPQEKRQNLARACYKEAEKLADNCIPAKLALADYYAQKNKDKATEILQKALETNPRCISVREKLRQMFSSRQWPAEAFGELQQLVKLMPDNVGLIFQMASHYYSQQNYAKALEYYKRAYDLNGNKYRWSEISINATLTNNQQPYLDIYQEMLKVQPDNPRYYRATASIYYTLKDYARVEELYLKVLSMTESDKERYEMYDDFARLYDDWNKPDKEREYRQKLNALPAKYQRYQDGTRRYYDFKDGKKESWPEEVTVPVLELVKSAPGEKEYPQAGSIILFEQHLVRVSGTDTANLRTKETRVHEVIKLLNKQAGEQYGDLYKYGEIEEARVYRPLSPETTTTTEFRVLEPDPIQEGWGGLRLPELDKGSVIELKYIKREPFYYREPGEIVQIDDSPMFRREKQPVLHLRYVIALPKSLKYKCPPKYQNLVPELKDDGQTVTYIWNLKNTPDYDDEVMMPSEREVLPWADIYAGNLSFEKKLREYRSRYLKGRVPYNVRAKAAELTKDITDVAGKVRALYKFAVSEIKGGYGGYGSSDDTSLSHTLIEKEGSASGLMMGFLKALNIEAYWALPKAKFTPGIDPDKEGPRINDYTPLIYIPDNNLWLAPGQFVPFGSIPVEMQGGDGYVIMPDGVKVLELPMAPFAERCAGSLDLEINILADGNADVKGSVNLGGTNGAYWRTNWQEYASKQERKQKMEEMVGYLFPGAKLKKYNITKFNIDEKITPINFTCTVPQFARKTATGLEFKTVMKPMELTQYFLRETERKFPLRLHHYAKALSTYDRIKIILPDVATADLPESKLVASDYGCYSRWVKADGNVVSIERKFTLEEQDIPPQYYPAFSDFCKKIEQIEQEQVKLTIK
ncbi:MAG: DUF3857 domain-containing protein, partial [Planctomycetes bacterium]|nr:DUF3857 domain-containing protein [Planctomycetota bacterium]